MNILKDILSGALPLSELPRFIVWMVGRTFWAWVALLVIGVLLVR